MEIELQNKPILGAGIYTLPDVASILKLPYYKVDRWINKFWNDKLGHDFKQKYTWNIGQNKAVNFYTLIELNIFYEFSKTGVASKEILEAHKQLSTEYNTPYPFATKKILDGLRTDGRKVLFEINDSDIHAVGKGKQFYLAFIREYLKNLDFDGGQLAMRYWPIGKEHSIVCDPHHKFGMPVVFGTNIQTQVLFDMYRSKEPVDFISQLYGLTPAQVLDAVEFHKRAA